MDKRTYSFEECVSFFKKIAQIVTRYALGEEQVAAAMIELEKTRCMLEKAKSQLAWADAYEQQPLSAIRFVFSKFIISKVKK